MDWGIKTDLPDWPPKLVYLGGPIDFAYEDAKDWREVVAAELLTNGIATFSPVHAFTATGEATEGLSQAIMNVNFAAIQNCDLLLMNLGDKQSIGTAREIQQAVTWGIPVVAVLGRTPGHYLVDCHVYSTLEEAVKAVVTL